MKQESKQHSQEQLANAITTQATTREFATAEELLRHDAGKSEVPPDIAERLSQSIQNLPQPAKTWWQRWLKR